MKPLNCQQGQFQFKQDKFNEQLANNTKTY